MNRTAIALVITVLAIAFLALYQGPAAGQAIIAIPGGAGLVAALWELIKARVEHEHTLEIEGHKNAFTLGVVSHMADMAFDKHVAFSEAYVARVMQGLIELFRDGPTQQTLNFAAQLFDLRRQYALWLTDDIETVLEQFEAALREIGSQKWLLAQDDACVDRKEVHRVVHDLFRQVIELRKSKSGSRPEIAVMHIKDALREHLGITKLTQMRRRYLDEAEKRRIL